MKTVVYLMRHTQALPQEGVSNEYWKLSDEGKAQSFRLVPALKKLGVNVVYSSPYPRAIEAIKPFAEEMSLDIHTHKGFRDIIAIDKTVSPVEFQELVKKMFDDKSFSDVTGESLEECQKRFVTALNNIAKKHEGEKILIVSHGMPIASILHLADNQYGYKQWSKMAMPDVFMFVSDGNSGNWNKSFKFNMLSD